MYIYRPEIKNDIVTNYSITNRREAYNLLDDNGLINDSSKIRATEGIVELLCGKYLTPDGELGVIPLALTSAISYPSVDVDAAYRLIMCQYAKSKLMSIEKSQNVDSAIQDLEASIERLKEAYFSGYQHYLTALGNPVITTKEWSNTTPELKYGKNKGFKSELRYVNGSETVKSNEDLVRAKKEMQSVVVEARNIFSKLDKSFDFTNIRLTDEAIKDFVKLATKIVEPMSVIIEEGNDRSIFGKEIRKFFSFKGDWADEETILAISKMV